MDRYRPRIRRRRTGAERPRRQGRTGGVQQPKVNVRLFLMQEIVGGNSWFSAGDAGPVAAALRLRSSLGGERARLGTAALSGRGLKRSSPAEETSSSGVSGARRGRMPWSRSAPFTEGAGEAPVPHRVTTASAAIAAQSASTATPQSSRMMSRGPTSPAGRERVQSGGLSLRPASVTSLTASWAPIAAVCGRLVALRMV